MRKREIDKRDVLAAFQLLRYLVWIGKQDLQQQGTLRPIFPVVLYHGPVKWTVGLNFWSLFDAPEELRPYLPDYRYWLCDLSQYSEEEIEGAVVLRATLLALKYILPARNRKSHGVSLRGEARQTGFIW